MASMIIHDADFGWPSLRPAENDSPLVIDANGVESAPSATQRFEPVSRWNGHVGKRAGAVELDQPPQPGAGDGRESTVSLLVE